MNNYYNHKYNTHILSQFLFMIYIPSKFKNFKKAWMNFLISVKTTTGNKYRRPYMPSPANKRVATRSSSRDHPFVSITNKPVYLKN